MIYLFLHFFSIGPALLVDVPRDKNIPVSEFLYNSLEL
jgi:hypothetical protein